jgi:peptidoglycan-associated lipoprotein
MNTSSRAVRSSAVALAIAPLLLLFTAACATTRPPVASAPPTPGVAAPQAPGPSARAEPTSGTIAISDEIRSACGIPQEDAFFAFDSAAIESADVKPLDAVARCFTQGPLMGRRMHLIGHADPRGESEYNMALGQRRADAVERYIDRHGVQASRLTTTSRGAMDATGRDESGWAHDRRVDVDLGG